MTDTKAPEPAAVTNPNPRLDGLLAKVVRPLVWQNTTGRQGTKEAMCEMGVYNVGMVHGYIAAIWRHVDADSQMADEVIGRVASEAKAKAICEKHRAARTAAALDLSEITRQAEADAGEIARLREALNLLADDQEREADKCKAASANTGVAFAATIAVGLAAGHLQAAAMIRSYIARAALTQGDATDGI